MTRRIVYATDEIQLASQRENEKMIGTEASLSILPFSSEFWVWYSYSFSCLHSGLQQEKKCIKMEWNER